MKLDLLKAYDIINWLHLRLILLHHVGFILPNVKWIMGSISSVYFVVLINGLTSYFFKPARGSRQGCHLSPLFFLLIVKGLSRATMDAKRLGIITCI
jgi:hypothetical protein